MRERRGQVVPVADAVGDRDRRQADGRGGERSREPLGYRASASQGAECSQMSGGATIIAEILRRDGAAKGGGPMAKGMSMRKEKKKPKKSKAK
jgi:hypothetical protein